MLIHPTLLSAFLVPSLSISIWQTIVFAYGRTYTEEWYESTGGVEISAKEIPVPLSPFVVCKNIYDVSLYMRRVKD